MSTDKKELKSWFSEGLKPTQEQFWEWIDSYYHKNESLSIHTVNGLENALLIKANKDASDFSPEDIESWKRILGVNDIPENIATNDIKLGNGELISGTSYTKEQSDAKYYKKVDMGYFNSNYVLLADGTPKAAGDLGKNIANSSLTSVAGAGLTLGADWTVNTSGLKYSITGLNDVTNDATFTTFLSQNAAGTIGRSNGVKPFLNIPTIMSESEKTAWKTSMNGGWTTNAMNVGLIYPSVVPKATNSNNLTFITLIGSNLNLNPSNFSIKIINSSGVVTETINNSRVTLVNANMISFSFNTQTYELGDYTIRLWNGVADYNTSVKLTVFDNSSANEVDISRNVWSRVTIGNLPFDNELVKTPNELNIGYDADLFNAAGQNDNVVLLAYYMQSFLSATDDFVIEGVITKVGTNYNPFGGAIGFGITTSPNDTLTSEKNSGAVTVGNNSAHYAYFTTGGYGGVNVGINDNMKFIISKKGNFATTSIYKDDGSFSVATNIIDNNQPTPVRFKIFATSFQYTTNATLGVKISSIRKL
ncbi:IPT/TIG domain-containing protein [Chryseobacterium gambrini]|uniref:Uncharacterized protein n=1 Tax=Chryseobacterium gambrini TaxID=373672 RepID=A0A1N7MJB7_9FLAO|nr:IPT/TIG domain-containing protein [Chryseobacterium gambrini]SIS86235.1 hypothetical protein SAMN05421785_103273 [Chryseobacterium gambrini]